MLSNLQAAGRPALQSFLLGQPQFREILASPDLDQLRQRVIASYHLGPLDAGDTRHYIEHRLSRVGWNADPALPDDVFDRVYDHSGGVPRRINTLMSRVLLFGFLEEKHALTGGDVVEVARDLERELNEVTRPMPVRAAATAPPPGANGEQRLRELIERIEAVENHVRAHDKTIKRTLQLIAEYLDEAKS